ncbi:MAG: hypothetical protein AAF713_13915 [Pseudomonadota bacterium]
MPLNAAASESMAALLASFRHGGSTAAGLLGRFPDPVPKIGEICTAGAAAREHLTAEGSGASP